MAAFRFSRRAEADLLSTGKYTLHTWGKVQTARYLGEFEAFCQILADNPALGRACNDIRPDLRRKEWDAQTLSDGTGPIGKELVALMDAIRKELGSGTETRP